MPDSPPTNCLNLVTWKLITTLCYSTNIIIYFFITLCSICILFRTWDCKWKTSCQSSCAEWWCKFWGCGSAWSGIFSSFYSLHYTLYHQQLYLQLWQIPVIRIYKNKGCKKKDHAEINREFKNYVYGKWEIQVEYFFS